MFIPKQPILACVLKCEQQMILIHQFFGTKIKESFDFMRQLITKHDRAKQDSSIFTTKLFIGN